MKNTDDNCSEPVLVKKENYLPQQSLSASEKKSSRSPLLAKRTATTSSSGLGSPSCTIFSAPPDDAEDKKPCIPSPSAQQEGNVSHRHDAFYSHHNHEIKSVMCNDEEDDNDAIGSDGSDRASDDGHELIQKGKQCTKKSFCHRSNYDDNENTIYDTEGSNNQQTGSGHEFMIDPAISALYHNFSLEISSQPPIKTVYQRILKPFPSVLLLPGATTPSSPPSPSSSPFCGKEDDVKGKEEQRDIDLSASLLASLQHHQQPQPHLPASSSSSSSTAGNMSGLFVEASLVRNDNGLPLSKCLDGNCMVRLEKSSWNPGVLSATFKKLKILSTSQQLQGTLFRLKFTLKKYTGNSFATVQIPNCSVLSHPIEVFSHSQYLHKKADKSSSRSAGEVKSRQPKEKIRKTDRCTLSTIHSSLINAVQAFKEQGGTKDILIKYIESVYERDSVVFPVTSGPSPFSSWDMNADGSDGVKMNVGLESAPLAEHMNHTPAKRSAFEKVGQVFREKLDMGSEGQLGSIAALPSGLTAAAHHSFTSSESLAALANCDRTSPIVPQPIRLSAMGMPLYGLSTHLSQQPHQSQSLQASPDRDMQKKTPTTLKMEHGNQYRMRGSSLNSSLLPPLSSLSLLPYSSSPSASSSSSSSTTTTSSMLPLTPSLSAASASASFALPPELAKPGSFPLYHHPHPHQPPLSHFLGLSTASLQSQTQPSPSKSAAGVILPNKRKRESKQ